MTSGSFSIDLAVPNTYKAEKLVPQDDVDGRDEKIISKLFLTFNFVTNDGQTVKNHLFMDRINLPREQRVE